MVRMESSAFHPKYHGVMFCPRDGTIFPVALSCCVGLLHSNGRRRGGRASVAARADGLRVGDRHGQGHGPRHRRWRGRQHGRREECGRHLGLAPTAGVEEAHVAALLPLGAHELHEVLEGVVGRWVRRVVADRRVGVRREGVRRVLNDG